MGRQIHFMVDQDVFKDPRLLGVAADHGPEVWVLWLWVLAEAKVAQCEGELELVPSAFCMATGVSREWDLLAAMGALEVSELIDFTPVESTGVVVVDVLRWDKWQSLSGRERSKRFNDKDLQDATQPNGNERPGTTQRQIQKQKEPLAEAKGVDRVEETDPDHGPPAGVKRPSNCPVWIHKLWAHYLTKTHRSETGSHATILTPKRMRAAQALKRDGYTPASMALAVNGYALSTFHQGENKRKARYDKWDMIMSEGHRIEYGIELLEESKRSTGSGKDGKIDMAAITRQSKGTT